MSCIIYIVDILFCKELHTMKLKPSRKKKFSFKYLFLTILSLLTLCIEIILFPPSYILDLSNFKIPIIYLFLITLFSFSYFAVMLISRSHKHSILVALFIVAYLLFRLNNLTHPLFLFLLIALFLTLELLFSKFNDKKHDKLT